MTNRGTRARAGWLRLCAAGLCLALLASCVESGNRRGSNSVRRAPAGAEANTVALFASGAFEDTDGNGYGDANQVLAYVYADPMRYPIPIEIEGSFTFTLTAMSGHVLAEWKFDEEAAARSRGRLPAGPGYVFQLSLLQASTDKIEQSEAELRCEFRPHKGEPIRSRLSAPLIVGRTRPLPPVITGPGRPPAP